MTAAEGSGSLIPATFLNAPTVHEDLTFYWVAFHDLHTTRHVAMVECPISWLAIRTYATHYGIVEDTEFSWFLTIMRAVDSAYLRITAKIREDNKGRG